MAMGTVRPLGALVRGLAAGAAASGFQNFFFKAAGRFMPPTPEGVFTPPEDAAKKEMPTQTVARRAVEHFAQRGPLPEEKKAQAGMIVHYAFGSGWGGLYGLTRESFPFFRTPLGVFAYSTGVWMIADNMLLPAFRLAAPAPKYPLKNHAFAWAAHLAYGAALWASYEVLRPQSWVAPVSAFWALRQTQKARRVLPKALRPAYRNSLARLAAFGAKAQFARSAIQAAV